MIKNCLIIFGKDRPKELDKNFFMLEERFTGQSFNEKVNQIRPKDKINFSYQFTESVCWLLNIRGHDVENTPLIFSRLILTKQKIELFVNKNKKFQMNSSINIKKF